MSRVRLGTRGSALALWQAQHVANLMAPLAVQLIEIQTSGDRVHDAPLAQLGGDGVFTKEIQRALLDRQVDVAVHSLKDLPTEPVPGLVLGAVPARGPVGDVLISREGRRFDELPTGARLATSSVRRRAQALHRRPDLQFVEIRGNVETRLRKLGGQELDGLILAEAGLERLGLSARVTEVLDPTWFLPAVGQGALGLECRAEDAATRRLLGALDHLPTHQSVLAERAFLHALGGGCRVPIGALSSVTDGTLVLRGVVVTPDGRERREAEVRGPVQEAEGLGRQLAHKVQGSGV